MHFCRNNRRPTSELKTELTELTRNSTVVHSPTLDPSTLREPDIVAVMLSGGTNVHGEKLKERSIQKTTTATDQYSKVTPPEAKTNISKLDAYYGNSQPLTRAQEKEKEASHRSRCDVAKKVWNKIAGEKKFDEVQAPLSVYDLSVFKVSSDPRRTTEYKQKVLKARGYEKHDKAKHGVGLAPDDFSAVQDALW